MRFALPRPLPRPLPILALLAAGCSGPGERAPEECTPLFIVPAGELRLAVGTKGARAVVDGATGDPAADVVWEAEDPGVILLLDDGVISAKAAGTTSLTARSACGSVARSPVRVLDRIEVEPASLALQTGDAVGVVARGADGTMLTAEAVWTGIDGTVARVDDGGTISAVGPGATTIRATWQGLSAQVSVEVLEVEPPEGHLAWTLGAYVGSQDDFRPATADAPGVVSIGNCGQKGSNHIWLSGEIPASSAPPPEQRSGWATIAARILAPDPGEVRRFRSFVVFDPPADPAADPAEAAEAATRPGTLFAPTIEWRTPDYNPEAWTGRTVELVVTPDDPDLLPSSPAVFELVDLTTPQQLCCHPGDC